MAIAASEGLEVIAMTLLTTAHFAAQDSGPTAQQGTQHFPVMRGQAYRQTVDSVA